MAHRAISAFARPLRGSVANLLAEGVFPAIPGVAKNPQSYARESESSKSTYDVPAGHAGSDLTDSVCNMSLQRMRDLTLREDLRLYAGDSPTSLKDVFKVGKSLLVGLPGGKICAEQHLPGYLSKVSELKAKELDKIICVIPPKCEELKPAIASADKSKVAFYEDRDFGFAQMLGTNRIGEGPGTQRYAGIVDNGLLLKLAVEKSPKDVELSSVESIMKVWDDLNRRD